MINESKHIGEHRHCLIDVEVCRNSNYEVLLDPEPGSGGNYTRGFVLDDEAKATVRSLAMEVGICDTCSGEGDWKVGFRAQLSGTVIELGSDGNPPKISVQKAVPVSFEGTMGPVEEPTQESTAPVDSAPLGPINCSEFQSFHTFEQGMQLSYVVLFDEESGNGNFSVRVEYEGKSF